jgi:hypothetical protein
VTVRIADACGRKAVALPADDVFAAVFDEQPGAFTAKAQATRFVTSNAPSTVGGGLTWSWMHSTSFSLLAVLQPNVGSPDGGAAVGGFGVASASVRDHGLVVAPS